MTNQDFDARLKAALDNLELPYDASTWAALEKRLTQPSAHAQDQVDEALRPTLSRLEASGQPNQWDLLDRRLTEQNHLRRRIWVAKLSEAAIFLLLLANLEGWLQGTLQEPVAPIRSDQPIAQHSSPASGISGSRERQKSASAAGHPAASVHNPSASLLSHTTAVALVGQPQVTGAGTDAGAEALPVALSPWATSETPLAASAVQPLTQAPAPFTIHDGISPLPAMPASALWGQMLTPPEVRASAPQPAPYAAAPGKAVRQSRFYASSFAAFDQNTAHVKSLAPQTSQAYGGGLAAGYRTGKWGVEMGVAYSPKRFRPRKQVEIVSGNINKGYYGVYVQEVNADAVTVPLKVTRRLARAGRASLHAVAGLSATIATEKAYVSKSVYYPGFQPQSGTDPAPQPTGVLPQANGVLESGPLSGNAYANAVVGLRVEHSIGKHYTAFIEASGQPALTRRGIAPEASHINTVAFQAGVMAGL